MVIKKRPIKRNQHLMFLHAWRCHATTFHLFVGDELPDVKIIHYLR